LSLCTPPQVTLFIAGVLEPLPEVQALLQPFGSLVRLFGVTNPAVRHRRAGVAGCLRAVSMCVCVCDARACLLPVVMCCSPDTQACAASATAAVCVCVSTNQGLSKHYMFAEFGTPDAALAALRAINKRPKKAAAVDGAAEGAGPGTQQGAGEARGTKR
jgi:hypothetical protein